MDFFKRKSLQKALTYYQTCAILLYQIIHYCHPKEVARPIEQFSRGKLESRTLQPRIWKNM